MGGGYFQMNRVRMGQRASRAASKAAAKKRADRNAARSKPPPSTITKPKPRPKLKRRTTNSRRAYTSERSARSIARQQRSGGMSYSGNLSARTKPAIKARRKKASMSQKYGRKKLGYSGKKTWHW